MSSGKVLAGVLAGVANDLQITMLYLAIYNLKYIVRLLERLTEIPGKTGLEYTPILSPALDITFTKHRPRIYASKGHLNCFIQN